jgi:hypothetical protein
MNRTRRKTWRKMAATGMPMETGQLNRWTSISSREVNETPAFIAVGSPVSASALLPAALFLSDQMLLAPRRQANPAPRPWLVQRTSFAVWLSAWAPREYRCLSRRLERA